MAQTIGDQILVAVALPMLLFYLWIKVGAPGWKGEK